MTEVFPENPEARELHTLGIELATGRSDFNAAHRVYGRALDVLQASVSQSPGQQEALASMLQESRIIRDDSFVYVRQAIASSEPELLTTACDGLLKAQDITHSIIAEEESVLAEPNMKFLASEHGATLALLGRTATVLTVMTGNEQPFDRTANDLYVYAAKYLLEGSNRYYDTSNSINAARSARYNGEFERTLNWLGAASWSILWSRHSDEENFQASLDTFKSRVLHLVTREKTKASILSKP